MCTWIAAAEEKESRMSFSNNLAEVIFALDDLPTRGLPDTGHTVLIFYITKDRVGMGRSVYNWAEQGGHNADTNAVEKAAQCAKLLKSLDQPKELPESPNHIITVRGVDAGKIIEKRFPISHVPPEVHQILTIMGCGEEGFKRLTFIQKTALRSVTNGIPHAH